MPLSNTLSKRIQQRINDIAGLADQIPGIVMIHDMRDMSIVYMSQRGLNILDITLPELKKLNTEYHNRYFNSEENKEYVPKIKALLERNNDEEMIALFQQVRRSELFPWTWYCTSLKIFMRNDEGVPILTIAVAIPIDSVHQLSEKIVRLLDENNFLRKNYHKFDQLGKREKEILKYIAMGKSSHQIAEMIFISPTTVDTHRRNIKKKLGTSNSFELSEYARAFDLV